MIYDCIIVGSGPAGISAAINLKIHQKSFLWFGNENLSDKIEKAEQIQNYLGLGIVNGEQMKAAFLNHINQMDMEIIDKMVTSIVPMGENFAVMAQSDFYNAKSIILATGVNSVGVIKGESEFLGRGVSYCATCDGNLYKGKTIAVICTDARFEHEVEFLSDITKKVYFFANYKSDINGENIEKINDNAVQITGDQRVKSIVLKDGTSIEVEGVFCLRNSILVNSLINGIETENGYIKADKSMATSIKGCFACGDCIGRPYQYAKAAGEGNVAAHSVIQYLSE